MSRKLNQLLLMGSLLAQGYEHLSPNFDSDESPQLIKRKPYKPSGHNKSSRKKRNTGKSLIK